MRCRECGAIILDTDAFCGKCGAKVKIDVCPDCGEVLRPGMRFCAKCGAEVIKPDDKIEPEDDEIPVTSQLATTDIAFDVIEETIIREAARQLDDEPYKNSDSKVKNIKRNSPIVPEENDEDEEDYYEDEIDDEEYQDYEESEEDDEYSENSSGLFSRLITAGMIVAGLILVLMIAFVFFNNRKQNKVEDKDEVIVQQTEADVSEEVVTETDNNLGTITIIKNVNIRNLPSTDGSEVLGVARSGETYSYYASEGNDNWIHIKLEDGSDGYVYKEYVKIN